MQPSLQTASTKVLALQHLSTPCAHVAGPCQHEAYEYLVPRRTDGLLTRLCISCREFGIWLISSALQFADDALLDAPDLQLRDKRGAGQDSLWQAQVGALVKAVLRSQSDHTLFWQLQVGVYEHRSLYT